MEPSEAIVEALIKRGWSFRDADEIKSLLLSKSSPDSAESELLKLDLRAIGAKSLPDAASLGKPSSYITGPKVLQVVSVRDVYRSRIDASSFNNSDHRRRLLRFILTDGHSEVKAIEFTPITSVTEELPPGTKIRLDNKVAVRSGILCLNQKVVAVLGGVVPSLYEEWQMSRKYSGFARSSLRLSQNEDGAGPPPFEKLQIEARSRTGPQRQAPLGLLESSTRNHYDKNNNRQEGMNQQQQMGNRQWRPNDPKVYRAVDAKMESKVANDSKMVSAREEAEGKPSTSEARPKEVSEAIPVQNQAAAQKLLQKMAQPAQGERNFRSHKHKFRGREEETQVFTLEEWERRKANSVKPMNSCYLDVSRDEELARQLQNQLDLEDIQGNPANYTEAEQLRMSMFSFSGPEESIREFRGRGRGRGRARGRGRGRGR